MIKCLKNEIQTHLDTITTSKYKAVNKVTQIICKIDSYTLKYYFKSTADHVQKNAKMKPFATSPCQIGYRFLINRTVSRSLHRWYTLSAEFDIDWLEKTLLYWLY